MLALFALALLIPQLVFSSPVESHLHSRAVMTVNTPSGVANGVQVNGAYRFVVRYATAERWKPSTLESTWALPNNLTDSTQVPLMCAQPFVDESTMSEDCLSMILYVPKTINPVTKSTLVWIHGGSFIMGSASGAGLDGAKLAIATGSVVAVVQYRLGALGFMAPDGSTNLAVADLINALTFLKKNLASFTASTTKITIAGQSSGAHLVRTLLSTPSAASLFQSAIMHSDPMNYEFLQPSTQTILQDYYNSLLDCDSSDTACLNALPVSDILNAELNLFNSAVDLDPASGVAEPMRPVLGDLVTSTFATSKPIMVTTVKDEAGPTTYSQNVYPVPVSDFASKISDSVGSDRTSILVASNFYQTNGPDGAAMSDSRPVLEQFGTDYIWRCASWTFARNWQAQNGNAFVGVFAVGSTYPSNAGVDFCSQAGSVCHEDDIEIIFGTVSNPTAAQSALTTQMQQYYRSFIAGGTPGADWIAATTTDVKAKVLGGPGEYPAGACDPTFWGDEVEFDYQYYTS